MSKYTIILEHKQSILGRADCIGFSSFVRARRFRMFKRRYLQGKKNSYKQFFFSCRKCFLLSVEHLLSWKIWKNRLGDLDKETIMVNCLFCKFLKSSFNELNQIFRYVPENYFENRYFTSLLCLGFCEVFVLPVESFRRLLKDFPNESRELENYSKVLFWVYKLSQIFKL